MIDRLFAGVDPGRLGGLVLLDEGGSIASILPLPVRLTLIGKRTRRVIDEWDLARKIDDLATRTHVVRAAVEKQQAMPMDGVVGAFTLGANYATIRMAFIANAIPVEAVPWAKWRAHAGLPTRGTKDKAERKMQSIARASDLWPAHAADFARSDGLAEGALAALWCLKCGQGAGNAQD